MLTGESRDSGASTDSQAAAKLEQENTDLRALLVQSKIDARHAAEAVSLANATARELAAIVAASSDAIMSRSLDNTITSWNAAAERLFGFMAGEMVGQSILRLIPPERYDEVENVIPRFAAGKIAQAFETVWMHKSGHAVDVCVTMSPMFDDAGQLCGSSEIVRDNRQRKLADDSLRAERERARQIIDSMFTFVGMLAPDGTLTEANNAALAAAGLRRSDVIGKPFWDCYWWNYDAGVQERLRAAFDRAVRGEVVRYEETIRVANDARANIDFLLKPIFDGGRLLFVIPSAEDVTERKAADSALRDRKVTISRQLAEINSIYASAHVGLGVFDRDLRYLRVNNRLAEMNGVSVADHIGRTMFEVTPDFTAFATEMAERVIGNGESILDYETSGETAAQPGVIRTWVAQWLPLRDPEGSVVGANVVVEEVTQQKRDVAELKLSTERLRASEARYRAAVDAIDGIVWTTNALGEVVGEQADWSSLTGQTPADSAGEGWVQAVHPDDAQPTLEAWKAAVAARTPYAVEHRLRRRDGQWRHFSARAVPIFDAANNVLQWVGVHRDVTERKERETHIQMLMGEVNHRSKNLLAVVMAVANQTGGDVDQTTFIKRFSQRIQSLATGQDLLVKNQWRGVLLEDLVCAQLGHFQDLIGGRITVEGGAVHISPAAAQTIGMALHELATNASKYGALSTDLGRVAIAWQLVEGAARAQRLIMSWTESDGPPVVAPTRRGFGSTVIGRLVKSSFNCEVTTDFARSGFSWRLDCLAEKLVEANPSSVSADVEVGR